MFSKNKLPVPTLVYMQVQKSRHTNFRNYRQNTFIFLYKQSIKYQANHTLFQIEQTDTNNLLIPDSKMNLLIG
jgi:hypothetical protein